MRKKPIFYLIIIAAIFFFLGKTLIVNWQKVKECQFSFNYLYLAISLVFPILTIITYAFIWKKILITLDSKIKISNIKTLKVFVYSWFGRYIPGKVLQPLGQVYLGSREGIPMKTLAISVIFENVLYLISAFLFSLLSLSITFGRQLAGFYYMAGVLIIAGGLAAMHPKIFYPCLDFLLRKLKKGEIDRSLFLSYKATIRIIIYNLFAFLLFGTGFFFLINSVVYLPWQNILGVAGIYTLSGILGVITLLPSGLGVREGILAGFLQFYFPLGVAILVSLVARLWATLPELLLLGFTYLANRGKK